MGTVMIRCPETGRAISTGIEADEAHFNCMPVFFAHSYCPFCRTHHEWFARNAWVCESGSWKARPGQGVPTSMAVLNRQQFA